jgi:glucose-6-phosphate isomerase
MDKHFVETNPRHNLPVLLALTDFWNDILLGSSARVVTPFSDAFAGYPKFVGAIESQTCCHVSDRSIHKTVHSSLVVDAGLDGAFDRAFFQSPSVLNTEIVMAMDSQIEFNAARALGLKTMNDVQAVHNSLMSSLFAHADDLAFGYSRPGQPDAGGFPGSPGQNINTEDEDFNNGNRPSLLLVTGKLDAFACGQLVALAEHRAIVKAHVSGIDPFVFEVGSSLRMNRTDIVKDELQEMFSSGCHEDDNEEDEDDDGGMHGPLNLATKTLLRHYASLVLNQQKLDVHRA